MRILLADDSALIIGRLQSMLSNYKHVEIVGIVKNGNDTLQALISLKPDLAIVDIKMPGLSGLQVLQEIRKVNKTVKYLILTLYPTEEYRKAAMQAGADYFFSKADDFEKVALVVEEFKLKELMGIKIKKRVKKIRKTKNVLESKPEKKLNN